MFWGVAAGDDAAGSAGALLPVVHVVLLEVAAGAEGLGEVAPHGGLDFRGRFLVHDAVGPDLGFIRTTGVPDADHVADEVRRDVGEDGGDQTGLLGEVAADALDCLIEVVEQVVPEDASGDPGEPDVVGIGAGLLVGAGVGQVIHRYFADRHVGNGVVAVVTEEIVGGVLPVGVLTGAYRDLAVTPGRLYGVASDTCRLTTSASLPCGDETREEPWSPCASVAQQASFAPFAQPVFPSSSG